MLPSPACVLCLLSPDAQQMVGPIAQATVIVAPIVLRDRLFGVWRRVRTRAAAQPDPSTQLRRPGTAPTATAAAPVEADPAQD